MIVLKSFSTKIVIDLKIILKLIDIFQNTTHSFNNQNVLPAIPKQKYCCRSGSHHLGLKPEQLIVVMYETLYNKFINMVWTNNSNILKDIKIGKIIPWVAFMILSSNIMESLKWGLFAFSCFGINFHGSRVFSKSFGWVLCDC